MLMVITFLKICGIFFGYSTIQIYFSRKLIAKREMTKIVSAYFVIQLLQTFFLHNLFVQWCLIFVPVGIFFGAYLLFIKQLESRFHYEFPGILTNLILQMKMGQSFRASLAKVMLHSRLRYRGILESIYDHVAFSQQKNDKKMAEGTVFAREILVTFMQVDQSSHRAIEKLENFRTRLIILNEFRRRSGQIRGQIQMQAYVLTGIYVLSFIFIARSFPLSELWSLLLFSFFLFIAGLVSLFVIGRRVKWNI
jgi:hypothetical protein